MYRITATVEFSYGHRLMGYEGKCGYLHGHNGTVEVDVEASTVDEIGMVVDFSHVKRVLKGWIDEHLDHQVLLRQDDPLASLLGEAGQRVYLMGQNPTAENVAKLIWSEALGKGLRASAVRVWETPTCLATFVPENGDSK